MALSPILPAPHAETSLTKLTCEFLTHLYTVRLEISSLLGSIILYSTTLALCDNQRLLAAHVHLAMALIIWRFLGPHIKIGLDAYRHSIRVTLLDEEALEAAAIAQNIVNRALICTAVMNYIYTGSFSLL